MCVCMCVNVCAYVRVRFSIFSFIAYLTILVKIRCKNLHYKKLLVIHEDLFILY